MKIMNSINKLLSQYIVDKNDILASNDPVKFQVLSDALVELAKELVSDIKNVRYS